MVSIWDSAGKMICHNYSSLPLEQGSNNRKYVNEWICLCSNKCVLTIASSGPNQIMYSLPSFLPEVICSFNHGYVGSIFLFWSLALVTALWVRSGWWDTNRSAVCDIREILWKGHGALFLSPSSSQIKCRGDGWHAGSYFGPRGESHIEW